MDGGLLRILGSVELIIDGEVVGLGGDRRRAIVALLAVNAGRVVSTAHLIDGVWGADPPPSVAKSLTTLVSRLRATLAPAGIELSNSGGGYRLDAGAGTIDLSAFRDRVGAARVAELAGEPGQAVDHLLAAIEPWQGEPLGGVGDAPFATSARVTLVEELDGASDTLVRLLVAAGRQQEVIVHLQHQVAATPYREDRWASLIRHLADAGRRADALDAYQQVHRLLAEDLGLHPGPGLREAERHALAEVPAAADPAPAADVERALGREAEQDRIEEALRSTVREGQVTTLLVTGEPGIGKTHLVRSSRVRIRARGGELLGGVCDPSGAVPLGPILRAIAHAIDRGDLHIDDLDDSPVLRRALWPSAADEELESWILQRSRLLDEVEAVVLQLARRRPLVLVVDDVQWADPLTLASIQRLGTAPDLPVLLLLIARGDGHLADAVGHTVAILDRHRTILRLGLGPLSDDALEAVITDAAGGCLADAELVEVVARGSGGNPLYAIHLAQHVSGPAASTGLPSDVTALCSARLAVLDDAVRGTLVGAAVLGEQFSPEALSLLLEESALTVARHVDAARAEGLLEVSATNDRARFAHGLVREAIYDEMSPHLRAVLHRRAGEVLRDSPTGRPGEVVEHLTQAGALVPPDELAHAALEAGRAASHVGAIEQAREMLLRGIDAVADRALEARLCISLAEVLLASRELPLAMEHLERATRLAEDLERWDLQAEAVSTRAGLGPVGTIALALEETARIDLLLDKVTDERQRAELLMARVHMMVNVDPASTAANLDEADAIARRSGSEWLARRVAYLRLRQSESRDDDPLDTETRSVQLLEDATTAGDPTMAAFAATMIQAARIRGGRLRACLADGPAFEEIARTSGRHALTLHLRTCAVGAQLALSTVRAGDRASEELERLTQGADVQAGMVIRLLNLIYLRREQGRLGELLPVLTGLVPHTGRPGLVAWIVAGHLEVGDLESARSTFVPLPEVALTAQQDWTRAAVLCEVADVAFALGDSSRAAEMRDALRPLAGRVAGVSSVTFLSGRVDRFLGRLAHLEGDLDAAVEHHRSAQDLDRIAGATLWAGWAAHDEALARRARRRTGDDLEAAQLLEVARRIARRQGSKRLARAVDAAG